MFSILYTILVLKNKADVEYFGVPLFFDLLVIIVVTDCIKKLLI